MYMKWHSIYRVAYSLRNFNSNKLLDLATMEYIFLRRVIKNMICSFTKPTLAV